MKVRNRRGDALRVDLSSANKLLPLADETGGYVATRSGEFSIQGDKVVLKHRLFTCEIGEQPLVTNDRQVHLNRHPSIMETIHWKDIATERILGEGAQGSVLLAVHKATASQFALKCLPAAVTAENKKTLLSEIKGLLVTADCADYICKSYEAFFTRSHVYILMDYMCYGSLQDVIRKRGPVPEPYVATVALHALRGLHFLHTTARIIHRDIKPSNLLVNHKGIVHIADFGLAKFQDSVGNDHSCTGTRMYMSPERIQVRPYSYATDIWSLGLTIAECLCGRFPLRTDKFKTAFEIICYMAKGEVELDIPSTVFLSPEALSFIGMCIQADPANRASTGMLLEHPFIKNHLIDDAEPSLLQYVREPDSPF